ncbi:DUF3093 domain-containing protein [Brachybacterium sp. DNPG3]
MSAAAGDSPLTSSPAPSPASSSGAGAASPEEPAASSSSAAPLADAPAYRERLTPGIGTWVVLIAFGALFGVVIVPLSTIASVIVGVVGIGAMIAVGIGASPLLLVEGTRLSAGRASIDVAYLGEPETVEGEDWDRTMSTGFDPLAHHCTRGWIHGGLRVEVQDEEDPTTAWVLSSRAPADLALALRAARQRAGRTA